MAKPVVILDSMINLPEINNRLYLHPDLGGQSSSTMDQTKVDGIALPLVCINNKLLIYTQIRNFELRNIGFLPTLKLTVNDVDGSLSIFDTPGTDNEIQIQILPQFDNAYKKINLLFYVVDYKSYGSTLEFTAVYKLDELLHSRLESFGQQTTFDLCKAIAAKCNLGFVSNATTSNDKRWTYCANESYVDILERELSCAGSERQIFDAWVDLRNNLTLMDIYDRTTDVENDLTLWTTKTRIIDAQNEFGSSLSEPILMPAVLTNNNALRGNPLFISKYDSDMNANMNLLSGTDDVSICYSMDYGVEDNWYALDGNTKQDTITKFKYTGEYFGEFNYLAQRNLVNLYKRKINNNRIVVPLQSLQLGLMRGDKLNVQWYETNSMVADKLLDENSKTTTNNESLLPDEGSRETQILNKRISGQYYITGVEISYRGGNWEQLLHLIKIDIGVEIKK